MSKLVNLNAETCGKVAFVAGLMLAMAGLALGAQELMLVGTLLEVGAGGCYALEKCEFANI